jgi:outer membrane protein OmpA-like peptidoglycan-associated protein
MRFLAIAILAISTVAFAEVKVTDKALVLSEQIFFATGKAEIKSESHAILDEVAATLEKQKKLEAIEIGVHTDARGNDQWNLDISQARAEAIRDYLVGKGIATKRLVPKGYGETKPLDKGSNEKAWSKNRRTELRILRTS